MIPSEWLLAIPVAAAFGFMLAGLLRQASRADACLGCYWRQSGMREREPLDIDGCAQVAEHNICTEDVV